MRILSKIAIFSLILSGFFAFAAPALAAAPFLSVSSLGNNLAQISISNANPYSQVSLYEQQSNSTLWTVINNLGTTDGSGSFNQQTSLNFTGSSVSEYVVVGGLSSNTVTVYPNGGNGGCGIYNYNCGGGCTYNCGTGLSLSQTSVSVNSGQTVVVTANNGSYYGGSAIYISSNSNPNVASYTISGNQISIYGITSGSTTLSVCGNNGCATLYVTVNGNNCYYNGYNNCGGAGVITLSQTSVSLAVGQTASVTAQNTGGSLYVSNNSNSSVVSVTASYNALGLYGLSAGNSTITVCASGYGQCATLFVTVSGNGGGVGNVTFSQSNVNLTINQNMVVYVYGTNGGSNSFYISNNQNNSSVIAAISGNVLNLTGYNAGSSTITVCQSTGGGCGSLFVTVGGYGGGGYGNVISFSQNNVGLTTGQSQNVTVYGNAPFYISSNSNSGVVSAAVSGSIISLYGYSNGSSSISVCSSSYSYGGGGCGTLYVNVNGGYGYGGGTVNVSQNSVTVAVGQTVAVSVYGTGPFYLSAASNSGVASGVMSGNTLNIYGSYPGTTTIGVCQSTSSGCTNVAVTVTGGNVLGSSTYNNGQLISINGTVYIVYKNTITAFGNASAFLGLGFSFGNVINVGYNTNLINSGFVISSSYGAHPWGSWVKSGQAIYFVSQYGLIPVSDYNTFLNNGGQYNLVVQSNSWDFQLPILSPMTYSDSRLR